MPGIDLVVYLRRLSNGSANEAEMMNGISRILLNIQSFFYHSFVVHYISDVDFVQNPEHLLYIEKQLFERPVMDNMHIHLS